jgi:diguanylate cyclase (GGDEF)-like protein
MQTKITLQGLQPYLSYLGTFVQLGGTLLLFGLLTMLRRYAMRRQYFRTWSNAWGVLALACFAVVLRYNLLPSMDSHVAESAFTTKLIYFVYQTSKFTFFAFLIAGTMRFVRAAPRYEAIVAAASFSILYGALSVWQSQDLNEIVLWQAPVAIVSLGYAALLMLRLPRSRRSLGSLIIGNCLVFGASLWAVYLGAFNDAPGSVNPLRGVVAYNTYLDLLWHLSLGFGMVVLLMEDVKHETDAAHAELAVAHDNLRRASLYDSVTGSLNRQAFALGLGLEAARAGFGTVVMLDMDDLKQVNDEFGHTAGDFALRRLVELLRDDLRPSDKLYRWGGDEFLLVFPGAETTQVGRRIRELLEASEAIVLPGGGSFKLRVSVGAAGYGSGEELINAIDYADRAMYIDKVARKARLAGAAQPA